MGQDITLAEYLERLPRREELRSRLAQNIEENKLLRKLLKLSEQRDKAEESRECR